MILDLPENPMEVEEALIPWCQIPLMSRNADARKKFLYAEDTLRARGIIRPDVRLIETQNFNKLRREKEALEAKKKEEEEKKRKEMIEKMKILKQTYVDPPEIKLNEDDDFPEIVPRQKPEPLEKENENKPPNTF